MPKFFYITLFLFLQVFLVEAIELSIQEEKMDGSIQELIIKDLNQGEGREAEKGLSITVHYTGWLYDAKAKDGKGKKFDSWRTVGEVVQAARLYNIRKVDELILLDVSQAETLSSSDK